MEDWLRAVLFESDFALSACPGSGESVFWVLAMMRSPFFIMVIILAWFRGDVKATVSSNSQYRKITTNDTNHTNKRAFFKQKVRGVREVGG
jgi:hypothetical protein